MGSEGSKIRRSKSTIGKKSEVTRTTQHIIPPKTKPTDSISCTDNLLNVGKYHCIIRNLQMHDRSVNLKIF